MNQMNQALLRELSGNKDAEIKLHFNAFPRTQAEFQIESSADGFIAAFIFSIGMSFIPASIISYIVKEREINIKH